MSIIVCRISQKFAILSILQTADQKQTYIYCQRRFWWDSQPEIIVRIDFGSEIPVMLYHVHSQERIKCYPLFSLGNLDKPTTISILLTQW